MNGHLSVVEYLVNQKDNDYWTHHQSLTVYIIMVLFGLCLFRIEMHSYSTYS